MTEAHYFGGQVVPWKCFSIVWNLFSIEWNFSCRKWNFSSGTATAVRRGTCLAVKPGHVSGFKNHVIVLVACPVRRRVRNGRTLSVSNGTKARTISDGTFAAHRGRFALPTRHLRRQVGRSVPLSRCLILVPFLSVSVCRDRHVGSDSRTLAFTLRA